MKTVTMDVIHHELMAIRKDIDLIKNILKEEYELSDETKNELIEARATPRDEYIRHEDMLKEFA